MSMHDCRECRDTGRVRESVPGARYIVDYCRCNHGWKLKADEIRAAEESQDKHGRDLRSADDLMGAMQ